MNCYSKKKSALISKIDLFRSERQTFDDQIKSLEAECTRLEGSRVQDVIDVDAVNQWRMTLEQKLAAMANSDWVMKI